MNLSEFIFGALLIVALLGLAGYFLFRQRQALSGSGSFSPEDRQFLFRQVRRRIFCSLLMVVLAGMLVGWFFIEPSFREMSEELRKAPEAGPNPEQKDFLRMMTFYWIGALLVFLGIMVLAAMDFLATARFGFRRHRQLESEHLDMLAKLRRQ